MAESLLRGPSACSGVEEIGDLIVDGQEHLYLSRRFDPSHNPLTSPSRQMLILSSIVETLLLPMLNVQAHILARGSLVASRSEFAHLPLLRLFHVRRTNLACPSSHMRLSDLTVIATSVIRRASPRDFNVSPTTRLYRLMAASTFERRL